LNNAAQGRHYFCRFTRGYPIHLFARLLSTSSLVSFLPSFHCTVTLLNITRCLRLILLCRITCVISLFVCVVLIRALDMSLTIHSTSLGKRKSSADGISGNRYLRSGSVRYREPQGMAGIFRAVDVRNWLRCHDSPLMMGNGVRLQCGRGNSVQSMAIAFPTLLAEWGIAG